MVKSLGFYFFQILEYNKMIQLLRGSKIYKGKTNLKYIINTFDIIIVLILEYNQI